MKGKVMIFVLAILLIAGGIYLLIRSQQSPSEEGNGVLCTQDVFECPEGSFVSRNPDNGCQFYDCPASGGASGTFPEGTPAQTHEINIQGFAFSPKELTIQVGDTIIWTNLDSTQHTVTSDSGTELDSEYLSKDETYSHTFTTVGNFAYHCIPHPSMKGTITVE